MPTDWDDNSGEFVPPRYRRSAEGERFIETDDGVR